MIGIREFGPALLAIAACGEAPDVAGGAAAVARHRDGITLITGDHVELRSVAGRVAPVIEPGPGRAGIPFTTEDVRGEITVIPQDVAAMIASGRLDRSLFAVSRLVAEGYGDDRRDDVPLIITGAADAGALHARIASIDLIPGRALPDLHTVTLRQRKGGSAALAMLADGQRVALDRRRRLTLDHSVPQIGAPAAYARGFTGAGQTVALVDSGVDSSHPDLAGKLVAAESFVADGLGPEDVMGHGTHVASIIAGSGAASNGRYHGVAPDATLVNARACDPLGSCFDSDILAAIEWVVVDQHVPIVNLSLSEGDTPELDPLEAAIDQYAAQYGTLFVVASGNTGPRAGSVGSPGTADAALTVGAVDPADQLTVFSGVGPRAGDHGIKPEITAPGLGIVAARAANALIGDPVDDFYMALSGTSMATPHVAGAAAILRQQHPEWTGEQLKAALVATAQPNPALTVFQQGAGRVDVDRVTRQEVDAAPATLGLGIATYPHGDDPLLVRTVHYTNRSAGAVTLAVAATLAVDGVAAPPGFIGLDHDQVTLAPGGAADVTVTVDTREGTSDGEYTGAVIATSGDVRIVTPIAVDREPESYDLTIAPIGLDGSPGFASGRLLDVDNPGFAASLAGGATTLRLPKATYLIQLVVSGAPLALLTAPRLVLAHDTTLLADARLGRPVALGLPAGLAVPESAEMYQYDDRAHGLSFASRVPPGTLTAELGPPAPPGEVRSIISTLFADQPVDPAVVIHAAHLVPDHAPTGWSQELHHGDLAAVHQVIGSSNGHAADLSAGAVIDGDGIVSALSTHYSGAAHTTSYYVGPELTWNTTFTESIVDPDAGFDFPVGTLDEIRTYHAGQTSLETWNRAPFGPACAGANAETAQFRGSSVPRRDGDHFDFAPSLWSDREVPARQSVQYDADVHLQLLAGDQLIAESSSPFGFRVLADLPPGPTDYRIVADGTRPADLFELSTEVHVAWSFRSQHAAGTAIAPLPTLRFSPQLDEHDATSAPVLLLPIAIERPAGAPAPPITSARVDASFDDGVTWQQIPLARVNDHAVGVIVHPHGATHVSLRGRATDARGNRVDQTIIRAYRID